MATKKAISSNKKSTAKKPMAKKTTVSTKKTEKVEAIKKTSLLAAFQAAGAWLKKNPLVGALTAEFIGTFMLVTAVFTVQAQPLYVSFIVAGIVLVIGGASGAYINPAMTIGAWVTRQIKALQALSYIIAEVLGAVVAWAIMNAFLSSTSTALSAQSLYHAVSITTGKEWIVLFAELIGSIILAIGIASAIKNKSNKVSAAFSYGFAFLLALLIAGWATTPMLTVQNTSLVFLNPAIAAVSNAISWDFWKIAIYIIVPSIGGIIGFAIYKFIYISSCDCDCDCCPCDISKK